MADVNDSRNLAHEIEKERERLETASIADRDKEAITLFANYRQGRVARNTLRQDMGNLRRASDATTKPLVDFDRRSDVDSVMAALESQGVQKADSKNAYLRALRQFFKWLSTEPEYGNYDWIGDVEDYQADDETRRLKKDEYLTESEVAQLQQAATHPREEALVEFLADTGARINLVCNLRRRDIDLQSEPPTFHPNPNAEDGYKGVTIKRYPIHYSERKLRRWVNKRHPDNHPDAPLFPVKIGYDKTDRQNMAMHPQTAFGEIKNLADATDIDRNRVSPHAFRHAAVRRMKTDPNFEFDWEAVKMRTAWSDRAFESMKELYGALGEDEQLDYFAERAGRESDDSKSEGQALFDSCRNCGHENHRDARYCDQCGTGLTDDVASLEEQAESFVVEVENEVEGKIVKGFLDEVRENPERFLD